MDSKNDWNVQPSDVPATDVPAADVPATDVPAADVPAADVPAADVPAPDVLATDVQPGDSRTIHCLEPGCNFKAHKLMQLQQHLTSVHGVAMNSSSLSFSRMQDFEDWKWDYERKHRFTFNRLATKNKSSVCYYYCSLGRAERLINGKRRLVNQCVTRLILTCDRNTEQVDVNLIDGHYGHPPPLLDSRVESSLSKREIEFLKTLMRRLNFEKNLVREHVEQMDISEDKKSLFMVEFRKKVFSEQYRYAESFLAESSIADWQRLMPEGDMNAIIIHKGKGQIIPDLRHKNIYHRLCMEDNHHDTFMLGVMTNNQKQMLLRYGKTIILELVLPQESVQGTKIMQLYVLVMDQLGREVQVGFFILNTIATDTRAFRSFFLAIKAKCGNLRPKLLIINERTCLFSYWREVFDGDVPGQLLSPWFVEAEFNFNLKNTVIADSTMQKLAQLFVEILREFNEQAFKENFNGLIHSLRSTRGAERALEYVTQTLSYSLNQDSSSLVRPKWAHHEFVSFKDDIASLINEFTPGKLNALHKSNKYKVGRCVYLMVKRGASMRSSQGSQTALSDSPDATKNMESSSKLDVLRRQENRRQGKKMQEELKKLVSELKNDENNTNTCRISAEILKITKLLKKRDSEIKIADESGNNLSSVHQNLTSSHSIHSEQSSSRLTGAGKRKQNFDSEFSAENSTKDPYVFSSYSSTSRPNKRRQISSCSVYSDAVNAHLPNSSSCEKNETPIAVRAIICNVPSSNPETSSEPITVSVSFEDYVSAVNSYT